MINPIKSITKKLNGMVWTLYSTGVMLLFLAVLTVFGGDFLGRLAIAVFVMAISYVFFYLAHKFWSIKNDIEKFFK